MTIIPISFGLNGNPLRGDPDARREQEALDAYSEIVTGVVESVAASMVETWHAGRLSALPGRRGLGLRHHARRLRPDE